MSDTPRVGIGALVVRDGMVLLGRRLASHGSGTWQIPGGHLEFGEGLEAAAMREATEESGLTDLVPQGLVSISNDIAYDKHYVSIGFLLESRSGEPTTPEPTKSTDWHWHDPHDLPELLFPHSRTVIENWLNKTVYTAEDSSDTIIV